MTELVRVSGFKKVGDCCCLSCTCTRKVNAHCVLPLSSSSLERDNFHFVSRSCKVRLLNEAIKNVYMYSHCRFLCTSLSCGSLYVFMCPSSTPVSLKCKGMQVISTTCFLLVHQSDISPSDAEVTHSRCFSLRY